MTFKIKCRRCGKTQDPKSPRPFGTCQVCLSVICQDCCARAGRHFLPGICARCGEREEAKAAIGIMRTKIDLTMNEFSQALRDLSIKLNVTKPTPQEAKEES